MSNDELPPARTDAELDNLQRMLDPCSPLDFLWYGLRYDWTELHWHLKCQPTS